MEDARPGIVVAISPSTIFSSPLFPAEYMDPVESPNLKWLVPQ